MFSHTLPRNNADLHALLEIKHERHSEASLTLSPAHSGDNQEVKTTTAVIEYAIVWNTERSHTGRISLRDGWSIRDIMLFYNILLINEMGTNSGIVFHCFQKTDWRMFRSSVFSYFLKIINREDSHLKLTAFFTSSTQYVLYCSACRNLPYKITNEEIYDIFGKYGDIRQIRVFAHSSVSSYL